jgi:hypothetical protein
VRALLWVWRGVRVHGHLPVLTSLSVWMTVRLLVIPAPDSKW